MKEITAIIPVGSDRKLDICESLKQYKNEVKFIVIVGPNPSENRNKGIKKAKTELVAFLNAHSILTEDWLDNIKKFFKKYPEIDVVGGPQFTNKSDPMFERASGYALSSIFGAADVSIRYKSSRLNLNASETDLTSANLICKKRVLNKIKFDENLWPGEDPKFISEAKKAGFKVAYSPDIAVYNKRRKNSAELAKQIFNYGFTRTRKESINETIKKPFFLIPSLFVIYLLMVPTLLLLNSLSLIPIIIYLILIVFFSFYETIKNNDIKPIFLIPYIFLIIHFSYGIGFLFGLISKRKR